MITGIPLRSLGCQSLWPIFVLVMLRRRRRVREYGCYQFFAIENECKICVWPHRSRVPRGKRQRSSVKCHSSQHNGIDFAKMGTRVAAPTDQQWIEKTNNRIEIENSISFECDRTGFWKSGFDFVWFGFPRALLASLCTNDGRQLRG